MSLNTNSTIMGTSSSKRRRKQPSDERRKVKSLTERIRFLQEEIKEMICEREKEVMVFACREAEWKRERKRLKEEAKRLKEEAKRLRKVVEEKEEKVRGMELAHGSPVVTGMEDSAKLDRGWPLLNTAGFLVEQMREERAWRDEAVEKWKQLYLAIKTELDDLIQKTHGDVLCRRAEEDDLMEELKREVKSKEETIEGLRARLASQELKEYQKEREIDILRQSLRIMSSMNKPSLIHQSTSRN